MAESFERCTELLTTNLGNSVAMFDPERGKFFGVLGAGPMIWERLAAPVTLGELEALVRDKFDVPADAALDSDIANFIDRLLELGLAKRVA